MQVSGLFDFDSIRSLISRPKFTKAKDQDPHQFPSRPTDKNLAIVSFHNVLLIFFGRFPWLNEVSCFLRTFSVVQKPVEV